MAKKTLTPRLSVVSLLLCSHLAAAETHSTDPVQNVNYPCDFSTSRRAPEPALSALMNQLPAVEQSADGVAAGKLIDNIWHRLYSSCINSVDANAIIWRLTQTADRLAQYDKALSLLKNAAQATSDVEEKHRFLHKAATQAMLAGKENEAQQIIKSGLSDKKLPAELWYLDDANNRLQYILAHLTVPLTAGQWTLEQIHSTGQRDGTSVIRFTHNGDGVYNVTERAVVAEISLHYRETEMTAQSASTEQTQRPWLYATTQDAELAARLPDFPGENIRQIKAAEGYHVAGNSVATATWQITQGPWEITARATFAAAHSENALQQLTTLFSEIQWPQADALPPILNKLDALTKTTYHSMAEWNNVARQASLLLPAAKFPYERARVNALLGIQAYQQHQLEKAGSFLQQALTAYSQTFALRAEENYGPQALQMYLTDIAYRTNKQRYTERVKASLMSPPMDKYWVFEPATQTILNKKNQLRYPFNVGVFHASAFEYTEGTVVYSAAKYGYSAEFFAGTMALSDINAPKMIKDRIRRLQVKDRQRTPLTDKDLHKTTYPFSIHGQKKTATKWSVKWYSDKDKTTRSLIYWTFPFQNGAGGIVAVVDNKDKAVLPALDEFARKLAQYAAPAKASVSGERNHVSM